MQAQESTVSENSASNNSEYNNYCKPHTPYTQAIVYMVKPPINGHSLLRGSANPLSECPLLIGSTVVL